MEWRVDHIPSPAGSTSTCSPEWTQGHTAGRTGFLLVRTPTASAEVLSNRTTPVCTDAWGHLPPGATSPPRLCFTRFSQYSWSLFLSLRRSQMVSREVYSTVFQSPTEADCCVAPWTFSLKTEVTFIFFPSHWEMCHLSKIIQSGPAETSVGSLNTHQVDSIKKRGLVYLLDSANKVTQDSLPSANTIQRMQLKCCFLHF